MLSKSYNDIQAKILYKRDDAADCPFTRDNTKKAQDQLHVFQKNYSSSRGFGGNSQTWNRVVIRYFTEKVVKTTK